VGWNVPTLGLPFYSVKAFAYILQMTPYEPPFVNPSQPPPSPIRPLCLALGGLFFPQT
jgi:hypothetical protein